MSMRELLEEGKELGRKEMQAELAEVNSTVAVLQQHLTILRKKLEKQSETCRILRNALDFYADGMHKEFVKPAESHPSVYERIAATLQDVHFNLIVSSPALEVYIEDGARARHALNLTKET